MPCSPVEYLGVKLLAEVPLDVCFAAGFGWLLHRRIGLRLPSELLVGLLALNTACCASLGLAIGSLVPGEQAALAAGLPVMIVYMVLGIINPAGAAAKPPSVPLKLVGRASPIKWCIRALCCSELRGMELAKATLRDAPRVGGLALVSSGDQVLERLGLTDESTVNCARQLGWLVAAQFGVALVGQMLTQPRFRPMAKPPPPTERDADAEPA